MKGRRESFYELATRSGTTPLACSPGPSAAMAQGAREVNDTYVAG